MGSSASAPSRAPLRMRLQRLVRATALTVGSTGAFLHPSARPRRSLSRRCACTRTSNDDGWWFGSRPPWTPSCQASWLPLAATSAVGKGRNRRRTNHGSRLAQQASSTAEEEEVGRIEARNYVVGNDDGTSSTLAVERFVTPPLQVYIEDTDAYGVMYNGNYLRAYDRALHTAFVPAADDAEDEDSTTEEAPRTWASRDDGWSIVSVEELKFKSPPPFGGTYCIEGTRRRPGPEGSALPAEFDPEEEVWDMVMRSPDGSTVYNTATGVTLAHHPSPKRDRHDRTTPADGADVSPGDDWLPCPPPLSIPEGSSSLSSSTTTTSSSVETFRTYRDEFEPHLDGHVPLRIALNYMERSRTNAIGGPARLRDLQTEHGILYVVTAVRNGSLVAYGAGPTGTGSDHQKEQRDRRSTAPRLVPGARVDVETAFRVRKRGAVIDCYHTLVWEPTTSTTTAPTTSVERYRVAQGVVTIMALDAATRRPTNKLPAWLLSRFDGSARS